MKLQTRALLQSSISVLIVLFVLFGATGKSALGHPHAWIDLKSAAVFDTQGNLIAIDQYWLFGDFYSAYLLSDIKSSGDDMNTALRATARDSLNNLREYNYFTEVKNGQTKLAFRDVKTFETGIIENRVFLKFTLELTKPFTPRGSSVQYAVFDPTYYIEILHAEGFQPSFRGGNKVCLSSMSQPQPTFEERSLAASLDKTETAGNTLGANFAEWVTLQCG